MTHQPLKYIQPQAVLWFTNASGFFSQGWKSSHQLPMSHSSSQTAPLAPDSDLFLQAHVTAVSVTVTQGDRICCQFWDFLYTLAPQACEQHIDLINLLQSDPDFLHSVAVFPSLLTATFKTDFFKGGTEVASK